MVDRVPTAESGDAIAAVFKPAPGTEILYDAEDERGATSKRLHQLQHVRKGDSHILLVPQPSLMDPNDPLRWSLAKKWTVLMNGVWYAFNGAVTGPIMAAGVYARWLQTLIPLYSLLFAGNGPFVDVLQRIVAEIDLCEWSYPDMPRLCDYLLDVRYTRPLTWYKAEDTKYRPFAVKFGRRPVYLLSNLLMCVACIWLGIASKKSYTPFLVGRAFLGIFEAPTESIVPSTIMDVFHLHDRGEKVSIYGLSVLGGNELGPMLSAFIIQSLGMSWAFYIIAAVIAANLVTMFLFMPETKFNGPRPSILPEGSEREAEKESIQQMENIASLQTKDGSEQGPIPKKTYWQSLAFWGAGDPNIGLLTAFLRPFVLMLYPTVLWSCIIYGLALGWNVILGATVAQLFAPPPYLFNSSAQGLIFLSPLAGSLVGTYLCGPLADRIANWYTKRNHGIREPEMRLPACLMAAILTFVGALWAGTSYHYKTHWILPIIGFGILSAGAQIGATLAMAYALDCHKELSAELMVTVASLKSLIAWIWTWVINDWVTRDGALVVFMVVATVNVCAYATTVFFYVRGKQSSGHIACWRKG